MRFVALEIRNFRAITNLSLSNLSDVVVIAGPNGCGKSQIFHAIRLLKSTYGGYQANEWQQWFGEFQIDLNRDPERARSLFRDRDKQIQIRTELTLGESEKNHLREKGSDIIKQSIWKELFPGMDPDQPSYSGITPLAHAQRIRGKEVEERTKKEVHELLEELKNDSFIGHLIIEPDLSIKAAPSPVLELLFSVYDPDNIGVIDYHGPHRDYKRERISSVNLKIQSSDRVRQHALYNVQSKYSNIKAELSGSYVRDLITSQVDEEETGDTSLTETLQELFRTFFPGKQFLGPQPQTDGSLAFPVQLLAGAQHDIDELSSGEKEVLYGYLRLRNTAPNGSVLLLDEPELHLNPRLLQGLPQFYHKHLGKALNNQIWLVTHSDALLRQAVGQDDFSVFHMQSSDVSEPEGNQLHKIEAERDLERAIIDLVGDLASYRPGAKIVIFEGGGNLEFDIFMTGTLFPEFQAAVNMISGGSKKRVNELHDLLQRAVDEGDLPARFFSIVDRDTEAEEKGGVSFTWDRYHIENYLLEPKFIIAVLRDIHAITPETDSEEKVKEALKMCARDTLNGLLRHEVEQYANESVISTIHTASNRTQSEVTPSLRTALERSFERMRNVLDNDLSEEKLNRLEQRTKSRLNANLKTGEWIENFRGRDILKHFVTKHIQGVSYDVFRNLIVSRMRDQGFKPEGMNRVIEQILASG